MFEKLKKTTSSLWVQSKVFKSIVIAAFFLFMVIVISLLVVHGHILLGISFSIIIIIGRLIVGIILRKLGYVELMKELAPRQYSTVRRVQVVVGGGLFTGFAVLTTLRVLYGPLSYPQSFLLFLTLIAVGAIMCDILGRILRAY